MSQQGDARAAASRLYGETGRIYIADTVRPNTRGDGWIRGGWADKTSQWVVIDAENNQIVWLDATAVSGEVQA